MSGSQNYRGKINHKNIKDFVKEFEEEHQGNGDRPLFIFCHIWGFFRIFHSIVYMINSWFKFLPLHVSLAVKWLDIHTRVRNMIRSVFEAAAVAHPEMHSPTSRAMYGVDVMLDSSFQPKLLEVGNWSSDPHPMLLLITTSFIFIECLNQLLFPQK